MYHVQLGWIVELKELGVLVVLRKKRRKRAWCDTRAHAIRVHDSNARELA